MVKIMELKQEQFKEFQESSNKGKTIKDILGIAKEISIGDTVINVENAKPLDVFKNNF